MSLIDARFSFFRAPRCVCYLDQNQTGGKLTTKGVLGFCVLLVKTCEYDAAPVFQKILDIYRADLSVDESLFGVSNCLPPPPRLFRSGLPSASTSKHQQHQHQPSVGPTSTFVP